MFKFDFALDDGDVDLDISSQLAGTHIKSASDLTDVSSSKINEDPFAEITLDQLLERLPNVLSYSPLVIPVLAKDGTASGTAQGVTLARRDLFDARFQLIAQESTEHSASNAPSSSSSSDALAFVEAPSDLVPGVYEGGLKTWECSVDLAGYLSGLGTKLDVHGKRIIEYHSQIELKIGCGTAVPSMFLLRELFSTSSAEVETEIHVQDYNASVLELVSFPNLLLSWYISPAAASFRASEPPPEAEDDSETPVEASPNGPGDLFLTPGLKSAFLASLEAYKIHLRFFSGSWRSFPVAPYDIVLTSETIYRSESLSPLLALLKGAVGEEKGRGKHYLCLVAAKVLYFGVGGGVEEFAARVKDEGGTVDNVWEVAAGVGRRVMSISWE
ncbi:hypothetical protein DXG01_004757 [Tephrocybe rancida]|nr:hypothetical protein DXG01_004757 [Tephrocybe rancida]